MQSSSPKRKSSASSARTVRGEGQDARWLATATRLLTRLASLDFACFEHMAADVAVPHMAAGPYRELDRVLLETLRLSAAATLRWGAMPAGVAMVLTTAEAAEKDNQEAVLGMLAQACDEGSVPALDDSFAAPLGPWGRDAAQVASDDEAGCTARADAVAHAMAHLMRQRARLRLQAALVSKWGMVACGENARRDARLWLRALLVALGHNRPDNAAWQAAGTDPLAEAVLVRDLLLRLRADVLATVDLGLSLAPSDIGLHLREVHLRIAALRHERHYPLVRPRDRFALGQFHGRLQSWLDGDWDEVAAARQLLLDLAAFAERLADVNNRQVLLDHDRGVQAQALALLAERGAAAPVAPMHELQALLERLRWRSPELATFLGDHDELSVQPEAARAATPLTAQHVAALTDIVARAMAAGRD